MLCRSITWFFCTFVAVLVAANSIHPDSITGPDTEVTVHHLPTDNLDSSTMESIREVRPDRAVDLGALLDAGPGATVVLVAGDTRLLAHRAVLAARSPVLQRVLQDTTTGEVTVPDVEGSVLRQLVGYLYTLQAPPLPAVATQLLAAAHQYGLPALKADCERQLAAGLSAETAAAAAVVAVRHSCDSLRRAAVAYIRAHIFQVMATQGWADAISSQPRAMAEVARLLSESPAETSKQQVSCSVLYGTLPEEHRQILAKRLVIAASAGQSDELRDLLQLGAPVDAADGDGVSALFRAVEKGRDVAVRRLIDAGADVDVRGPGGRTPLHTAAENDDVHAVWMLLGASAHTDVRDDNGETPLHLAVKRKHESSIKALLIAGARRDIRNNHGWTPAHWATSDTIRLFNTIN